MLNKKFFEKLLLEYKSSESERRQIISLSNVVLHESKRIIFTLHRKDIENAKNLLVEVEKALDSLEKKFGNNRLVAEGSYLAATEEYVEAKMLYKVLNNEKIDKFNNIKLNYNSYLGGICDLTGELVRVAINEASSGKLEKVEEIKNIINDIMAELVKFDMTGYLRTKYDQAKTNLKKIEQINYEIKIRK